MTPLKSLVMKISNIGFVVGVSLMASASYAASSTTTAFQQGVENAGALGEAAGSAIFTWIMVIGLVIIAAAIGGWFWSSNPKTNAPDGFGKWLLIGVIAGTALTFVGGILGGAGEMLGVADATDTVDYRDLGNVDNN